MYESLLAIPFEEANQIYKAPNDGSNTIYDLHCCIAGNQRISIWKCKSLKARLRFLFRGEINLVELANRQTPLIPRTLTIGNPFE